LYYRPLRGLCLGRKCYRNWGCCYFLFKTTVKGFIQYHVFAQSPLDQRPSQHFSWLLICAKMFHSQYYLVAMVIHMQSLRSQICVYTHILHNIRESSGAKEIKIWDSTKYHVLRTSFRVDLGPTMPMVWQPCYRLTRSAHNLTHLCRRLKFFNFCMKFIYVT